MSTRAAILCVLALLLLPSVSSAATLKEQVAQLAPGAEIVLHNRMGFTMKGAFVRLTGDLLELRTESGEVRSIRLHLVKSIEASGRVLEDQPAPPPEPPPAPARPEVPPPPGESPPEAPAPVGAEQPAVKPAAPQMDVVSITIGTRSVRIPIGSRVVLYSQLGFSLRGEFVGFFDDRVEVNTDEGEFRRIRLHLLADIVLESEAESTAARPRATTDAPCEHAAARPPGRRFNSLDRYDTASFRTELRFDVTAVDESTTEFLRTELYGQLFHKRFGGYLSIPISRAIVQDGNDENAFGNLEVGGYGLFRLSDYIDLGARVGLSLPTASWADGSVGILGMFGRLTDMNSVIPGALALRLALAPRVEYSAVFAQLDVGLDFLFFPDSDIAPQHNFRLNFGAGIHFEYVEASAELVNRADVSEMGHSDIDASDRFWHTLAFRVALPLKLIEPSFAFTVPLDDMFRGDFWVLTFALSAYTN